MNSKIQLFDVYGTLIKAVYLETFIEITIDKHRLAKPSFPANSADLTGIVFEILVGHRFFQKTFFDSYRLKSVVTVISKF